VFLQLLPLLLPLLSSTAVRCCKDHGGINRLVWGRTSVQHVMEESKNFLPPLIKQIKEF